MSDFVVLEQHSPARVAAVVAQVAADGGRVVEGWRRPVPGVRLVCVGRVETAEQAAAAVMSAVGGARLVIEAAGERDIIDRLCDDLRRLGSLDHRIGVDERPGLAEDERSLLALLLGGATLGQAAQALHISRRTADRRLASARAALGAQSTPEVVAMAARIGVRAV